MKKRVGNALKETIRGVSAPNTEIDSGHFFIPREVLHIPENLERHGYKAYLVGGCVRDLLLGRKPKDWDVATNATPEQIIALFPKTFYENVFGTVGVVNETPPKDENGEEDQTVKVIEVTPFRLEGQYSDNRRPDSVEFSDKLEDDLKRRDFTVNAIALSVNETKNEIVDLYGGREDIKKKRLRAVGDPDERFKEDALRLLRAVRIVTELGFTISVETEKAIRADAHLLKNISAERIRDEFSRILLSKEPLKGIKMAQNMGLLSYIVPELEPAMGVEQTQAHSFDVWEHLLRFLQHASDMNWPLDIRLAALLHDVAKPETRRWSNENNEWTFYGHDVVGSRVAKTILTRLKFSKEIIEKVTLLVRWHMFFTDTEQITLSAVRRMVANVGKENIWDLMDLRICDRIGTGRPKANPYRLRKYQAMVEEAMRDPISVGMLKIDGNILMKALGISAGPKIGFILHALLEEVLEDPDLNTEEHLQKKARELSTLSEEDLKKMSDQGKEKKALAEQESIGEIRKKHGVR